MSKPCYQFQLGAEFDRLVLVGVVRQVRDKYNPRLWLCRCRCGRDVIAAPSELHRSKVKSCGCWREEAKHLRATHGHSRTHGYNKGIRITPEYEAFIHAKQRCTNPKNRGWHNYGGRGIRFLFTSFEQFFAELGPRPEGAYPSGRPVYSVDRFPNNNGHYEPGNVRWATAQQQVNNSRRWPK